METVIYYGVAIVIVALLEVVLSIDNSVFIATLVSTLRAEERKKALFYGLLGAYVFRALALFGANWIMQWDWVNLVAGMYLFYLCSSHLQEHATNGQASRGAPKTAKLAVVIALVEVVDLIFSLDNVLGARAICPNIWVVCLGVFIGIAAMRFVAGYFVKLIEKYPGIKTVGYLVIGYIGLTLASEELFEFKIGEATRLLPVGLIVAGGALVIARPELNRALMPLLSWFAEGAGHFAGLVDWLIKPLQGLAMAIVGLFKVPDPIIAWLIDGLKRAQGIARWITLPLAMLIAFLAWLFWPSRKKHE